MSSFGFILAVKMPRRANGTYKVSIVSYTYDKDIGFASRLLTLLFTFNDSLNACLITVIKAV